MWKFIKEYNKKYAKVFTMAYNQAFDYNRLKEELKLMTQGFYYPPACMMKEFCKFIPLVEKDKAAYIGVKMAFQQDIKNKDLKDLESH